MRLQPIVLLPDELGSGSKDQFNVTVLPLILLDKKKLTQERGHTELKFSLTAREAVVSKPLQLASLCKLLLLFILMNIHEACCYVS